MRRHSRDDDWTDWICRAKNDDGISCVALLDAAINSHSVATDNGNVFGSTLTLPNNCQLARCADTSDSTHTTATTSTFIPLSGSGGLAKIAFPESPLDLFQTTSAALPSRTFRTQQKLQMKNSTHRISTVLKISMTSWEILCGLCDGMFRKWIIRNRAC